MRHQKHVQRPGSLIDRRPISREQLARLDQVNWQANPERYARQVWAQISRWVEG